MSYYGTRKPHYLGKNHTTTAPSSFLFFDTETKAEPVNDKRGGTKHTLWFGHAQYFRLEGKKRTRFRDCTFEDTATFWDFFQSCLSKHRPLWVFAHNLPFDFTIVDGWRRLEREEFPLRERVLDGVPMILGWMEGEARVICVDTLNYWRTSLASIGKSIGLKKLSMPKTFRSLPAWHRYCRRDVEVIAKALEGYLDLIKREDLGTFRQTFPSQALTAFRHRFMSHSILIHNVNPALELERGGYYGGLVRNYYLGSRIGEPTYHFDVNSLYPFCMLNPMPTRLVGVGGTETLSAFREYLGSYGAMAHVELSTGKDTYPLKYRGKLVEASGRFDTILAGPELLQALSKRHIRRVLRVAYYSLDPIFVTYVHYFYAKRLEYRKAGDLAGETFCKYMLNSLYGKFGQRSPVWRPFGKAAILELYRDHYVICKNLESLMTYKPPMAWGKDEWFISDLPDPVPVRVLGGQVEVGVAEKEAHHSCPAIAAYVTSYARVLLRKLISEAGEGNTYYCDTDSLFVNQTGKNRLEKKGRIGERELGKLKHEGTYNMVVFYGPKDYEYDLQCKTKGVRKSAIELGPGEYLQEQFEGLKSILNRDPDPYIRVFPVHKELKAKYDKGTVRANGWVDPLHFPLR